MEEAARALVSPHDDTQDVAIVRAVRAGDSEQFALLFRAYYDVLVRFAYITTRAEESAEEVVDDVFMRLWENHAVWTPSSTVRAYLYRAVRNRAIDAARANASVVRTLERAFRRDQDIVSPAGMGKPTAMPDELLVAREHQAVLQTAIASLGEPTRLILTLRWDQGMSWAEVADVAGLTVEAAQMKHTRALRVLRTRLVDYFD